MARLRAGRHRAERLVFAGAGTALLTAGLVGAVLPASAVSPPILERIKQCESGGNYRAVNPRSGASGAYQFLDNTWRDMPQSAGYAKASHAPPVTQDRAAQTLYAQQGTRPWNASRACWG
jgi:hypothetical protein